MPHSLIGGHGATFTELSFRDTRRWFATEEVDEFPVEGGDESSRRITVVLLGDEEAGPLVSLGCRAPSSSPPVKFPAHGHDSDTWRMPLLGQTSMGTRTFRQGEFRFWPGGRPYGSDDTAWGPAGGWNITLVGDRRGMTMRTLDESLQAQADMEAAALANWVGFRLPPVPPRKPGLSSTLEASSRAGNFDESFANGAYWPERVPGIRGHVGLLGHHRLGPILWLTSCDPGARLGEERFDTEVLHIVAGGSARVGDRTLEAGDIHLIPAGRPHPELVVGPDGLCGITLFGDRSRLGEGHGRVWATWLSSIVDGLKRALAT